MFRRDWARPYCLHAASLKDCNEIRKRLMAAGATYVIVTYSSRKLSLSFRDPDRLSVRWW